MTIVGKKSILSNPRNYWYDIMCEVIAGCIDGTALSNKLRVNNMLGSAFSFSLIVSVSSIIVH